MRAKLDAVAGVLGSGPSAGGESAGSAAATLTRSTVAAATAQAEASQPPPSGWLVGVSAGRRRRAARSVDGDYAGGRRSSRCSSHRSHHSSVGEAHRHHHRSGASSTRSARHGGTAALIERIERLEHGLGTHQAGPAGASATHPVNALSC